MSKALSLIPSTEKKVIIVTINLLMTPGDCELGLALVR
jgi:hypothetical protein